MRLSSSLAAPLLGPLAPWLLAAALVLMAGLFVGGYLLGRDHAATACRADKADALTRLIAEQARVVEQDYAILFAHQARQDRVRTVFRTILQEAGRYALDHRDTSCGLDAAGLRIWAAANAAEAPAAAEPDYSMSGAAAAGVGPAAGTALEPRGDGGAVPRLQGAPAGALGMGEE